MKLISSAMLFLLVFSAIPLVHVSPYAEASAPGIVALDVCNTSGSALHAGLDFPYMGESTDTFSPEKFTVLHDIAEPHLMSSLFTSRLERPPRY